MKQTIKLGFADGVTPFEIRFLHNPASTHGFVGSAFGSTLYHFYMPEVNALLFIGAYSYTKK